jgi:hypothetical protein
MTNKLIVIINSLKVPKLKKILLYEMKFLVPNYSCLQNPCLGGYCPQIPVLSVLGPQLNLLQPSPNKIPGYATATSRQFYALNFLWLPCNKTVMDTDSFATRTQDKRSLYKINICVEILFLKRNTVLPSTINKLQSSISKVIASGRPYVGIL